MSNRHTVITYICINISADVSLSLKGVILCSQLPVSGSLRLPSVKCGVKITTINKMTLATRIMVKALKSSSFLTISYIRKEKRTLYSFRVNRTEPAFRTSSPRFTAVRLTGVTAFAVHLILLVKITQVINRKKSRP